MGRNRNKQAEGEVEVRMLVDHQGQMCGAVAVVDADTAKAWVAAGVADDHPDAVAYARSLEKPDEK